MKQLTLIGAVILLSWQLSALIWLFVPSQSVHANNEYAQSVNESNVGDNMLNMQGVVALNLFGMPKHISEKNEQKKQISAPETSLNLKLRGLRKGQGAVKSSAIIENARGVQDIYYLGDKLDGYPLVTVHEIYPQRLILERTGKYETLTLFDFLQQKKQPEIATTYIDIPVAIVAKTPIIDKTRNHELSKSLSTIAETLQSNPLSLNGTMAIEPFEDGSGFQGYKVSPGQDKLLFVRLGFVKGDILTKVNDIELDSSGKILSLMGTLSNTEELEVKVMRKGQPLIFRYKVK